MKKILFVLLSMIVWCDCSYALVGGCYAPGNTNLKCTGGLVKCCIYNENSETNCCTCVSERNCTAEKVCGGLSVGWTVTEGGDCTSYKRRRCDMQINPRWNNNVVNSPTEWYAKSVVYNDFACSSGCYVSGGDTCKKCPSDGQIATNITIDTENLATTSGITGCYLEYSDETGTVKKYIDDTGTFEVGSANCYHQ